MGSEEGDHTAGNRMIQAGFSSSLFFLSLPFQGPPGPYGNPGPPGPPGAKVSIISGHGVTEGWGLICGSSRGGLLRSLRRIPFRTGDILDSPCIPLYTGAVCEVESKQPLGLACGWLQRGQLGPGAQ